MRSRDPEEMEEPTLRGSKELYFIILSHLETPAQRKPCGYKEGKCNRCNRMQQRLHCFACFNERCLLSRLSFPFEFHSLFPFRLPSLRSFSLPANGEQRSAAELHLRFIGFGIPARVYAAGNSNETADKSRSIERDTSARSNSFLTFSHAATFSKHEQQSETTGGTERAQRWRGRQQRQQLKPSTSFF